jgi:hypothetical protein
MSKGRLEVQPVMHRPNALAHYKKVIFFDGTNHMYIDGSANFTYAGLIRNGESFNVERSWGDEIQNKISLRHTVRAPEASGARTVRITLNFAALRVCYFTTGKFPPSMM